MEVRVIVVHGYTYIDCLKWAESRWDYSWWKQLNEGVRYGKGYVPFHSDIGYKEGLCSSQENFRSIAKAENGAFWCIFRTIFRLSYGGLNSEVGGLKSGG